MRLAPMVALPLAVTLVTSCGGGSNKGGGPAGPTPPGAAPTLIMIHDRQAWLRPGDQESVSTNARFSDGQTRDLPDATWSSSDTSVVTVAPSGTRAVITAVSPGEARLRVTSQGVSGEVTVRVATITPPPGPGTSQVNAAVVINEFRFEGPGGEHDEFIELRNRSSQAVDIGGWSLAVSDGAAGAQPMGNIPAGVTLGSGCHYLLISGNPKRATSESAIGADFIFAPALDPIGGLALVNAGGRIVDQVGTSGGSRYREGTPLAATAFASGGSFSRKQDSNDNAADFTTSTTATRANLAAPCVAAASAQGG